MATFLFFTSCDGLIDTNALKKELGNCKDEMLIVKDYNIYLENEVKKYQNLVSDFDSLLAEADSVVIMYVDTTIRDTIIIFPQCTLCYRDTININGIQYYVGYDNRHYKVVQEENIIRQVFYKDTTIHRINYVLHDSLVSIMKASLFILEARGTICDSIYPVLEVYANETLYKRIIVGGTGEGMYNQYVFTIPLFEEDITSLEIKFINDAVNHDTDQDRNAWVNNIMLNHHSYFDRSRITFEGYVWWLEDEEIVTMPSNGSIIINTRR